jgi:hypothetical protein
VLRLLAPLFHSVLFHNNSGTIGVATRRSAQFDVTF